MKCQLGVQTEAEQATTYMNMKSGIQRGSISGIPIRQKLGLGSYQTRDGQKSHGAGWNHLESGCRLEKVSRLSRETNLESSYLEKGENGPLQEIEMK